LRRITLEKRELYNLLTSIIGDFLVDRLKAIIVFGSMIYLGKGNDLDLLIIIDTLDTLKEKFNLESKISQILRREFPDYNFDVHIFSVEEFKDNLSPGSFLSGLALGYEVIYDKVNLESEILLFLERLSKDKYLLHNRYGTWNLGFHAKITYRLKRRVKL